MTETDPIMEEVYATRREISERFGHDPARYIASIREMKRRAAEAGMTFLAYCKSVAGAVGGNRDSLRKPNFTVCRRRSGAGEHRTSRETAQEFGGRRLT